MDEYNIPETLAACVDKLQDLKKQRLAQQKIIDAMVREESYLAQHIKDALVAQGATGISGLYAKVAMVEKVVPSVQDWDKVYSHILSTGQFDLLQRRVSDAAVKERWQAGEKIDGIGEFTVVNLSVTKV